MAMFPPVPDTIGALYATGTPLQSVCRNCGYAHEENLKAHIQRHGGQKRWRNIKVECARCRAHGEDIQLAPMIQRLWVVAA
jgi:rubredoxin